MAAAAQPDLAEEVALATTIKANRCNGDLEISLFWEEKLAIMLRYIELYGVIFVFYYEMWPSQLRHQATGMFTGFVLNFWIYSQDKFYGFMRDFDQVWYFLLCATGANLLFYGVSVGFLNARTIRFRIEKNATRSSGCNFYRFWFWVMEIMMLPLLINVSWPATCNFWTARDAIELTDCKEKGELIYWLMKCMKIFAFFCALGYNGWLLSVLRRNKISAAHHEVAIQKKEVEYVYKINTIWMNE